MPLIIGFNGISLFVKGDVFPPKTEMYGDSFDAETMEGKQLRVFWSHIQFIEVVPQTKYDEMKKKKMDREAENIVLPAGIARRIIKGTG